MADPLQFPITVTHPDKLAFWDFKQNGEIPLDINFNCRKDAYWICKVNKKHSWKQPIAAFLKRQTDCMYCSRKAVPERDRLSTRFPDLAIEMHKTRNKHIFAFNIDALSDRPVWWQCSRNSEHIFYVKVRARTIGGVGCPFCSAEFIDSKQSFATKNKRLVKYWDIENSDGLFPEDVLFFSPIVVAWNCRKSGKNGNGHTFRKSVFHVAKNGLDCVVCRRIYTDCPTLAEGYPHIANQWHKSRNNKKWSPKEVSTGSGMLVWWKCDAAKDHEWRASVSSRTARDNGCPFCSRKKTSSTNSFAVNHPMLFKEWHPKLNVDVDPYRIPDSYRHKVWWLCPANKKHEWQVSVKSRTSKGTGCPFCVNHIITEQNCLASTFPKVAAQWHPKLNRLVTARDVVAGSDFKAFWQCTRFKNHIWQTSVKHRTRSLTDCPQCKIYRYPKEKSLKYLFPKLAQEWDHELNAPIKPDMISANSNKKFWWRCKFLPNHKWMSRPNDRVQQGHGCPYCAGKIVSREKSLATLFPKIARQWHPEKNGSLKPSDLLPGSGRKVWWRCNKNAKHEWLTTPNSRTGNGRGCPHCYRETRGIV